MAPRRRWRRTLFYLAAVLLVIGVWRVWALLCPSGDPHILLWSVEPATAATWNAPQIPALAAENAMDNGGVLGTAVGRRLYRKAMVPLGAAPDGVPAPAYGTERIPGAWLGRVSLTWRVRSQTSDPLQRQIVVGAESHHSYWVVGPHGQLEYDADGVLLSTRSYLVVLTPRGWRVAQIHLTFLGGTLPPTKPRSPLPVAPPPAPPPAGFFSIPAPPHACCQ